MSAQEQSEADALPRPPEGGGNGPEQERGKPDGWAIAFGILFWFLLLAFILYKSLGFGDPELDIVVAASPADADGDGRPDRWEVRGHLIYDGRFVEGVGVWAIAMDQEGNRFSTGKTLSGRDGSFSLDPIPHSIGGGSGQPIAEIAVHARGELSAAGEDDEVIELSPAPERIGVGTEQRFRVIGLPVTEMLILAGIFALSVAVALVPVPEGTRTTSWLVVKYVSSVVFAFMLTVFMILYLALGMRYVNLAASNVDNEIMSLGMASIFRGRYVENASSEWLISLTSPSFAEERMLQEPRSDGPRPAASPRLASVGGEAVGPVGPTANADPGPAAASRPAREVSRPVERGFGAPLWVLLVAVLGSALFTISIILVGIGEVPLKLQPAEIRQRIKTVVLHQFYMLFAPIGAIFVYQLLVIAGAASQPAAVAVAVLAAGVSLNLLLEKARQTIVNLFSGTGVKLT